MIKRSLVLLGLLALAATARAGDGEQQEAPSHPSEAAADAKPAAPAYPADDQKLIDEFFAKAASKNSDGEKLQAEGKNEEAAAAFHQALGLLELLHRKFPQWDPAAVTKRRMEIKHNLSAVEPEERKNTAIAQNTVSGNGYALRRPMAEEFEHALRRMAAEELMNKGGDLLEIGLPKLAIPYFKEALKYDPGNPEVAGQLENALIREAGSDYTAIFF